VSFELTAEKEVYGKARRRKLAQWGGKLVSCRGKGSILSRKASKKRSTTRKSAHSARRESGEATTKKNKKRRECSASNARYSRRGGKDERIGKKPRGPTNRRQGTLEGV